MEEANGNNDDYGGFVVREAFKKLRTDTMRK